TLDGSGSESGSDITYQWYLDNAAIPNATSAFLTTTDAGEYTFEVFNAVTGCTNQETFTVGTDLVAPVADGGTGGTLICGQTSFTLDGSANSSIGTNYSYEWYKDGSLVGTGVTIDVGSAGDYTLVVTNTDNNCSATSSIVAIDQDANVPSIDIAPISNITCSQEMVTLDGSGSVANVGNLIYQWTDTLGNILGTTPTIDVNTPGAVTLLITDDANNCSSSQAITVIQDTEPPVANAGVGGTLLCGQTSLTLDGGGSNGNGNPITYNWLDPNGNSIGTAVTVDANGAGLYTLEIENTVNGCTSTSTVLVEQDINVPTALAVFSGMLTCDDEEITVDGSTSTSAGGGILTYQWSNGSTSPMATFTDAGTYSLMVTDGSNNCSATTSFTIDQDISTPTAEIASIGNTLSCTQQSLVFNGANSTPSLGTALTYSWLLNGNEVGSTDEIEVGDDGQLVLVVTNVANGCSSSTDTEITTDESLPVAIIADPDEITCINDEVELNATASSQGTEYQYSWTGPGAIINDTTLTPTMTAAGVYTLTVLNTTNGCEETQNITIDADTNPPAASANATDQLDCVTTEISLTGNGSATGPTVSYLWTTTTGNIVSGATTFTPTISAPGIYSLVVTDASNGCTSTASVNVDASNDTPVVNSYTVNDPNCYGENTGSITLDDVSGGELPYLYSINGSAFAPINQFSFLEAGAYNIIVQDVNGCETPTNIEVINPQELIVELGDDRTIGLGDSILLTPQVVGAYDTLFWKNCVDSNGCDVLDLQVTPLNTTTYSITLLDGNGCSTTDEITINVEKGREVFIPNVFTPNQDGNNDFFIVFGGQEVLKVHEFRVFNRWGEEVFERLDYDPKTYSSDDGWDGFFKGKIMKPGVFVYYVKIEYIDGRKEVLKGDVTLRR
ncbi:MAG TPA: T9SS type B sorting domain-containing protein, partial [Phaeodactylibacter sp.]|nr:T9SS type B sorting domain-containing protein [Phaeodactylibacter sp.]